MRSLLLILMFVCTSSFGQSDELLFGTSTKLTKGGTFLDFDIRSDLGYIDNYLYQHDQNQSTIFAEIKSNAILQIENRQHLVRFQGAANYIALDKFKEDNHSDYNLKANYHYKFTQKAETVLSGGTKQAFVYRGQGQTLGLGELFEKGDKTNTDFVDLTFNYGSIGSMAMLNASIGATKNKYTTRRDQTAFLDVQKEYVDVGFDYNISGKTYASAEVEYNRNKFRNDAKRNDRRSSALIGVKWNSSAITKIAMLLGYQKISFEQESIASGDTFKWKFRMDWSPLDHASVNLTSGRTFDDALRGVEDYRIIDEYAGSLNYILNRRLAIVLGASIKNEELIASEANFNLDYLNTSVGMKYKFKTGIEMYGTYDFNNLKSESTTFNYDRNMIAIGLRIAI